MKKLLLLISFLSFYGLTQAQDEAVFGHYIVNPLLINPGASGFDDAHHNLSMNIRTAWTSFPGAPKNYSLNYSGPIGKSLGLGAMVFSENIASLTRTRAQLSYAIRFNANDFKVSAGVSTEFHRLRLDNEVLNDPLYEIGDEMIENLSNGESTFDVSLGVYGMYKEQIYFGISAPSLIRNRLDNIDGLPTDINFLVNLGGKFAMEDAKITLEPSILVRQVRNSPLLTDVNLLASFLNEQLITGLSFRGGAGGGLGLTLGTKYDAIRFLYTYDVFMDEFQSYNGGSHELSVSFAFKRKGGEYDRSKKYRK